MYNSLIKELRIVDELVGDAVTIACDDCIFSIYGSDGIQQVQYDIADKIRNIRHMLMNDNNIIASISDNMVMREWVKQQEQHKKQYQEESEYIHSGIQASHNLAIHSHIKYCY